MPTVSMPRTGIVRAWRDRARDLASRGVPPEAIVWTGDEASQDLFNEAEGPTNPPTDRLIVPRAFVDLADHVVHHRDPERFARLYAALWRLCRQPRLFEDRADPAVARLYAMEKAVRRDMHKMTAFLRFREIDTAGARRRFVAWFEPEHFVTEITAPFFARRFGDMDWLIATPNLCARFEDGALSFLPGVAKPPGTEDPTQVLWHTYFRNIFNPARLKTKAMRAEMPRKYWHNLPETELILEMIAEAEGRVRAMAERGPTSPPLRALRYQERSRMPPEQTLAPDLDLASIASLSDLRAAAAACRRCPLYADATQVVVGEGPRDAALMVVGEQPGDQEDLAGRPFVGPAGRMFDEALREVGIARETIFVTNAVKHFKFTPRGKRRLHQRPNTGEVTQCRWWLDAERALVRPKLIVALGATAALATTGSGKDILRRRSTIEPGEDGTPVFLTIHPSYLLRIPEPARQAAEIEAFRTDLRSVAAHLDRLSVAHETT